jgi:hypothetical protein
MNFTSHKEQKMFVSSDDDAYKSNIYAHLQEKDTDELLDIWEENDRTEWTDEAFDAIRTILLQRIGQVPEQDAPRDEYDDQLDEEEAAHGDFPNEKKLIWTAELARNLSWINLGVAILYALYRLINGITYPQPVAGLVSLGFMQGLGILFESADGLIFAGVIFVLLQAVAEIIYLIMDIRVLIEPEETESTGLSDSHDLIGNG